ncbi:MAG: hypothetical protein ABR612_12605 [Chromatocurvus sp.]
MHYQEARLSASEPSLAAYFRRRLADCAQKVDPAPQEDTCWYLSQLLDRFGRSEDFFAWEEGRYGLRPLALLYGDAAEARDDRERCLLLQQLGDMALFLGALFPSRYERRGIRQDYFIGMGGGAYDYLAENARHGRHVFAELSAAFATMIELVSRACACDAVFSNEDILTLYSQWLETRNPVLESRLRALGVEPEPVNTLQ